MPGRGSGAAVRCTAGRATRLSAGGLDVFSAALFPGKALDLEAQRVREMRRDDVEDGAPPDAASTSTAGSPTSTSEVGLQPVGELDRTAQRGQVAAGHLVDVQPEPVGGDPALELRREQPVLAPGDDARGDVRPARAAARGPRTAGRTGRAAAPWPRR